MQKVVVNVMVHGLLKSQAVRIQVGPSDETEPMARRGPWPLEVLGTFAAGLCVTVMVAWWFFRLHPRSLGGGGVAAWSGVARRAYSRVR